MENNFEKEVQENLTNLNIAPSEQTWDRIAIRLQKRKRKKGLFWWFLPVLVLSVAIGLNYLIPEPSQKGRFEPSVRSVSGRPGNNMVSVPAPQPDNTNKRVEKNASRDNVSQKAAAASDKAQREINILAVTPKIQLGGPDAEGFFKPVTNLAALPLPVPPEKIPLIHFRVVTLSPVAEIKATTSAGQNKPEPREKAKWEFGFSFSPGLSYLTEGSSEATGMGNPANDPAFGVSQSSGQGIYLNNRISPPSYTKGFAFRVGLTVTRKLADKLSLNTGLQYRRSAIRQTSEFFSIANRALTEEHSGNVFNFLDLPLGLDLKTDVGKLTMKWEVGTSISYLLATNAPQFERNRFYKDNSLFLKVHPGISAGLSLRIVEANGMSLYAGPGYRYYPGKLAETGIFANQHFNFAGLNARISFSGKSK